MTEHMISQVQADGANLFDGRLPPLVLNGTTLARRCRRGASTPSLENNRWPAAERDRGARRRRSANRQTF